VDLTDSSQIDAGKGAHDFHICKSFLFRFSCRTFRQRFVHLEESCGRGPETHSRFDRASTKKDLVVSLDQCSHHDLGIAIVNLPTLRTDSTQSILSLGDLLHEHRSA